MKIFLFGRFNSTGGGRHAENFYRNLKAIAESPHSVTHVDPDALEDVAKMLIHSGPNDCVIFFTLMHPDLIAKVRCKKIIWYVFESDRMPAKIINLLRDYNAVWAPSAWGCSILKKAGLNADRLRLMPEGVEAQLYFPKPAIHKRFTFLAIGKYEKRKALDELVAAFQEAFPATTYPDVALLLKADHPLFPDRVKELQQRVNGDPRIKIIAGDYPEEAIIRLYQNADAYCMPSRAEGFGLPGLEAVACGLPLITVPYSGQTVYLDDIEGLYVPIAYQLVPLRDRDFEQFFAQVFDDGDFGQWAEPDRTSLAHALGDVYDNRALWQDKALQASVLIRAKFDWKHIAELALKALEEL